MKKKLLLETVADIAYLAGHYGYYSGDSREDMQEFIVLARAFEKKFEKRDWESSDFDYIIEVENFAKEHLELKPKPVPKPKKIKNLEFAPAAAKDHWDNIEIQAIGIDEEGNVYVIDEPKQSGEIKFWSVYLHQAVISQQGGGVQCIADLPNEKLARQFANCIKWAAKFYHEAGHLFGKDDHIKKQMEIYLSNDPSEYDNIIRKLRKYIHKNRYTDYLKNNPIEYISGIDMWEKMENTFTIQQFCEAIDLIK